MINRNRFSVYRVDTKNVDNPMRSQVSRAASANWQTLLANSAVKTFICAVGTPATPAANLGANSRAHASGPDLTSGAQGPPAWPLALKIRFL